MDMKLPIEITDELESKVIRGTAMLNLASGEVTELKYNKYDVESNGPPWRLPDYEFSNGMLSKDGRDVEFTLQIDKTSGDYSVSATELSELKVRAAALFSGAQAGAMLKSLKGK